jgi:hypothetical protein
MPKTTTIMVYFVSQTSFSSLLGEFGVFRIVGVFAIVDVVQMLVLKPSFRQMLSISLVILLQTHGKQSFCVSL